MIALLVMTDGRKDCIKRTIRSAEQNLLGTISERYINDDSGDAEYRSWLRDTFPEFTLMGGGYRRGFGGAINHAWGMLARISGAEYVFHLEDDFTFNRTVHLDDLRFTLARNGKLAQIALRRQSCNPIEEAAGGVVQLHPEAYTEIADPKGHWLKHDLFFTTNPSLYRISLTGELWPLGSHSEGRFTIEQVRQGFHFGYWGSLDSGEWVEHIGDERVGTGY